jgi:hypothetical protein
MTIFYVTKTAAEKQEKGVAIFGSLVRICTVGHTYKSANAPISDFRQTTTHFRTFHTVYS